MDEQNYIVIDEQEVAEFIYSELLRQGINLEIEDIMSVLAIETEFLRIKGAIIDDQRDIV